MFKEVLTQYNQHNEVSYLIKLIKVKFDLYIDEMFFSFYVHSNLR